MSKRSKFFNAMTCFFSNDQGGKQPKKKSSALKSKSKTKHDVLVIDQVPEVISKPKRHQINTAEPKSVVETIDLTDDQEDAILPIKIQILDETNKVGPFLITIKTNPQENTNISFNGFSNQDFSLKKCVETAQTTNSDSLILLKNENITKGSILADEMSLEKPSEPPNKDAPLLNQYHNYDNLNLSRNDNKKTSCMNDQTDEIESKSILIPRKTKRKTDGNSSTIDFRKKKAEKSKKNHELLIASKFITVKEYGTYYCTLCEESFKNKAAVLPHIKFHKTAKFDYRCNVCDELFQSKRYLVRHLKKHFVTSDLEPSVKSEQTKEKSSSESEPSSISIFNKTAVDCHETFNNLEKKLYSNNSTHASLIKIINDTDRTELNLACAYCDQCFSSQISLVEHCRTHMADRPFICNVCGTLFKQNPALLYHTRTHFRMIRSRKKNISVPFIRYVLRLHSCKDCDRSYVSWPALNKHRVDVHGVAEKKFSCDVCQRDFTTSAALRFHKKRRNCKRKPPSQQKVNCEICEKTICDKYGLKEHMLRKHPNY